MLDIKFIRENIALVKQAGRLKNVNCDVDRLCALDEHRRQIQRQLDELRHQSKELGSQMALYRNPNSDWYKRAVAEGASADRLLAEADELRRRLEQIKSSSKTLEQDEKGVLAEFDQLMLTVAQPADEGVPVGRTDADNVELRRVGEPPAFDFKPKDHVELGTALGILDLERGVKLAGTRNYVLCGDLVRLHHAVLRLAMDMMVERGFQPLHVPVLVRDAMMFGTGWYPFFEDQSYRCERDGLSLAGTAEVPLTSYHSDEMLDEAELPKKYVAVSPCFRREAGAGGKDTYGLYRIHAFEKVEQVIVCRNDRQASIEYHQEILANAEALVQALDLPYRVVDVCTGDLGPGQAQKFDIETWMPSRESYGETHSASRFYEFQARRLNLRYRDGQRKVRYCHTLNNTVVASPRILIPLLEVHQQADGSVRIPKALGCYMNGMDRIEAQK